MTVSVTAKSRTITNGTANDGSVVEAIQTELYNNGAALVAGVNGVLGSDSVKSAVDGKFIVVRNSFTGAPASGEHGGLEVERGTSANVQIRFNETNDIWEFTNDGTNYFPLSGGSVNAQTGTTYTVLSTDSGKLITFSNASAIAVTLPQANGAGFTSGFSTTFANIGAGLVTVTPTTSTIGGATALLLGKGESVTINSDGTNYLTRNGRFGHVVVTRSSDTILTNANHGQLINCTSAFTQTLTAAATLGNGWFVDIRNDSTGIVILDPNASETIDGFTTINVYPGEAFTLVCDGTNFKTVGRQKGMVLLATGTASTSATLDFSAGLADTEFSSYIVEVENLVPATDGVNLWLRVSTDNGSNYLAGTNYSFGTRRIRGSDGGNGFDWHAGTAQIELASATAGYLVGNAAGEGISGTVCFKNPTSTSTHHSFEIAMNPIDISTGAYNVLGYGAYKATTAITNIRFMFSSGNITSGKVKLYGVR